jgi:hypothetical protein
VEVLEVLRPTLGEVVVEGRFHTDALENGESLAVEGAHVGEKLLLLRIRDDVDDIDRRVRLGAHDVCPFVLL